MTNQILFGVVIVPAVIGLVQVCKDMGLPARYAPAAAVLFGILAGMAQLYSTSWPWIQAAVIGIALGLSAVGLYSGTTTALSAWQNRPNPPPGPEKPTEAAPNITQT